MPAIGPVISCSSFMAGQLTGTFPCRARPRTSWSSAPVLRSPRQLRHVAWYCAQASPSGGVVPSWLAAATAGGVVLIFQATAGGQRSAPAGASATSALQPVVPALGHSCSGGMSWRNGTGSICFRRIYRRFAVGLSQPLESCSTGPARPRACRNRHGAAWTNFLKNQANEYSRK
jgi:hypothetical protein